MIKYLDVIYDGRINSPSVLVKMSINDYLSLTKGAERNLDIQRRVVTRFKPYERLREDLANGCVIPPLVIGIKKDDLQAPNDKDKKSIEMFITSLERTSSDDVFIIDGLQRTKAIQDVLLKMTSDKQRDEFLAHDLRVEIWPNIPLSALTYRMILLNAGQKPMSLKHQLEIVSGPLCNEIESKFKDDIILFRDKDKTKRNQPKKYKFAVIASSFQAFVQRYPHIDIRNDVVAELNQISVLESYGESLGHSDKYDTDLTSEFFRYIKFLLQFDVALCKAYPSKSDFMEEGIPTGINFLSRDTVHLGLASAYSICLDEEPEMLAKGIEKLFSILSDDIALDPLSLASFEKIQRGFSRRDNTGEKTRELVFKGFKEFFYRGGSKSFNKCWMAI